MIKQPWSNQVNLDTAAGEVLKRLAAALPPGRPHRITLFGSAPLQIGIEPALLSEAVDVFSEDEELADWVKAAGLGDTQRRPYIQVCSGLNFRTSPHWGTRTQSIAIENCTFIFPHPIDILIAKLNRLEEKGPACVSSRARENRSSYRSRVDRRITDGCGFVPPRFR